MASTVNIRKLLDSPRHVVFHVFLQGDGKSPDLVNFPIINPVTDLVPPLTNGQKFSLVKVWYGLAGCDVQISFENSSNPVPYKVWVVPSGTLSGHVNFNEFGGISDKTGIDASGRVLISTTGLLTLADQGSLIIKLSKHNDAFKMP